MAGLKVQIVLDAADRISKPFRSAGRATDDLRTAVSQAAGKVRDLERTAADLDAFRSLKTASRDNARALEEAQAKADKLAGAMASAHRAAEAMSGATRKVRALEQAAKDLDAFRSLKTEARANASALHQAQARVDKLAAEMAVADKVTKSMMAAFNSAKKEAKRLGDAKERIAQASQDMRTKLAAAGIETKRMASEQKRLKTTLDEARQAAARLKGDLDAGGSVKALRSEFTAAKKEAARLRTALDTSAVSTNELRTRLAAAGVDTKRMATEQKRLKTSLDEARQAADRQGQALDRASKKTAALAKARGILNKSMGIQSATFSVGAAGLATGGAAMAVGGKVAGAGLDFEEQMSGVGALARLDKTSEAFKQLSEQAKHLGATTSFSASEAAGGMRFLAMSGFEATEIMAAMPGMLDLAKAGGTDLATTADIASNILSGFRLEADQMGRVGDVLAATFTRSNVDLAMLGDTMKYVAPIASELGTTVEEAAAMAGLLGNIGIQGSEAGTAMRALHTRMASPPPDAQKAFNKLGIATRDASGDLRSMTDILGNVAKQTEDMGSAERVALFTAIAGQEAGAAMAALVQQGGAGEITKFTEILEKAAGEAGRIAQQMGDNTAGDIKGFWSAVEGMNIALTETNISPLRDLVQTATAAVRSITLWIQENPALAGGLAKVAAVAAGLVLTGGALATAVAGIIGPFAMARFALSAIGIQAGSVAGGMSFIGRGFGLLGTAAKVAFPIVVGGIRAVTMALMTNPIGLIIGGIAIAAGLLIAYWEPISGFFLGLWDKVGGAFSGAWEGIKAVLGFTPLGLLISNWEPISAFFGGLIDGITGMFGRAWDWILSKISSVAGPLASVFGKVSDLFGGGDDGPAAAAAIPAPRPIATRAVAATAATVAALPVAAAAAPPPAPVHQEIQIIVNAAPGMDEVALAREVRRQIEEIQARNAAASRNRLYDGTD